MVLQHRGQGEGVSLGASLPAATENACLLIGGPLFNQNPRHDHIIAGLERKGFQLHWKYWEILRAYDLVRTAEEEEKRRFSAAATIEDLPGTTFAASVHRLLRACLRSFPQTTEIPIEFVRAGKLHLQLFFSEDDEVRVHDRWLARETAITELGLDGHLPEADVVFHTVKRLTSETLGQLPLSSPTQASEEGQRSPEWFRMLAISRLEQRLLDHLRMSTARAVACPKGPMLQLTLPNLPSTPSHGIEVQCHLASLCCHLREAMITTDDGE